VVHYKNLPELNEKKKKWEHVLTGKAAKIDVALKIYQQRRKKDGKI